MKVLHLLAGGSTGGIESLIKDYDTKTMHENVYVFIWNGGIMTDKLINEGKKVYVLNKTNKQFFSILRNYIQICKEENIQVVMTHHSSPLFKVLLVFSCFYFPNIMRIAYAHANALDICQHNKKGFQLRKLVHKLGFMVADGVIAISESVKYSLVRYLNVNEDKIQLIYNGVNVDKYYSNNNKTNDKIVFTFVGRLVKEKGVQNIINVFSKIDKEILDKIEFQVIGDGSYKDSLIELVDKNHLTQVFSFLGMRDDISLLLSNSDFFVHFPMWEEGFGITLIEAMASGNICLSLNKGGIPEIIENQVSGILFDENDFDSISNTIVHLIEEYDSDKIKLMKENAIERSKLFSIDHFSISLDQYIMKLGGK